MSLIDNQIDQATGSAKLKAIFGNPHNTLWPGQYVNVRVLVRTERNAMTIPSTAVQVGPNGPFTYVINGDSTVEVRPLTTGDESNGVMVVTAGLAPSEHVVTTNQYRLQPGTRVRGVSAPAPASAAAAQVGHPATVPRAPAAVPPREPGAVPDTAAGPLHAS